MFTVCEVDLLYIYDIIYHMLNKKKHTNANNLKDIYYISSDSIKD